WGWGWPGPVVVQPQVVVQPAPVFVDAPAQGSAPPESFWYYCPSTRAYYPNVSSCSEVWVKVPPRSERAESSPLRGGLGDHRTHGRQIALGRALHVGLRHRLHLRHVAVQELVADACHLERGHVPRLARVGAAVHREASEQIGLGDP